MRDNHPHLTLALPQKHNRSHLICPLPRMIRSQDHARAR